MKVLVLGATGMAGHTIAIYLKESGHDVTGFSRAGLKYCNNIIGDITNFEYLREIIESDNYDAVINAVGVLVKESENNKSNSVLVNSYLPHYLVNITKTMKTKIVHMSTDCVFSGKTGRYSETSLRDGNNFYDRTKALGEIDNKKDLTFRNSIIGPDLNINGTGLFNWFMQQRGEINGFTTAMWNGVTTITLAKAMEKAVEENISGIYNLVNNKIISKYELLTLFNKYFKDTEIDIVPSNKIHIDKSLVNNRTDFSFVIPCYEQMIIEMGEWIKNHNEFYQHYC